MPAVGPPGRQEVGRAEERGHELVLREVEQVLGRADLQDVPGAHHRHPVAEPQRLGVVVGHQHGGGAGPAQHRLRLDPQRLPQRPVEVGERLVEQHDRRVGRQRPGQGDALLLAAGELVGVAARQRLQPDEGRAPRRPACRRSALGGGRARRRCCRSRSGGGTGRSPGTPSRPGACRVRPRRRRRPRRRSPIRISPPSGASSPATISRMVDLPQPLGPISARCSPVARSSETPSTAATSPKRLTSPSSFRAPLIRPPSAGRARLGQGPLPLRRPVLAGTGPQHEDDRDERHGDDRERRQPGLLPGRVLRQAVDPARRGCRS